MEELISFGHWLKLRRQALRLTQHALAGSVACSSELIGKLEADARRPSLLVAERLAQHLGLSPHQRATFVRVARGELQVDRLPEPAQVPAWPDPAASGVLRSALPLPATPLVGREVELAELGALLKRADCRLITIAGPGGSGKTRLALAAAADQMAAYAHGVWFVPLAALSSAAFLAPTILAALGVGLQGQGDAREQLLAVLREKQLLLVLDNLEQLLPPGATGDSELTELLVNLLHHAPGVTLLSTSRERLGIPGEWLYTVEGLAYPRGETNEGLERFGAVELFVQRAQQVRRQFVLQEDEGAAVVQICRLVEGMPLAIELAAAGVRARTVRTIAEVLANNIATLETGHRNLPERHRSIRATFEHSWRLLSEEERSVFTRLSVFRGGFEEAAAADVAQATPQTLAALIDKSLLRWDGMVRYDVHELLRQYAGEKLAEAEESNNIRYQHLAYFLQLAEQSERELIGPQQAAWLERLDDELGNLRIALEWALESDPSASSGQAFQIGLQLVSTLHDYWAYHSPLQEGIRWLVQFLQHPGASAPTSARAKALTALGRLSIGQNHTFAEVQSLAAESLAIYRELGDRRGVASALRLLGVALGFQNEYAAAHPLMAESLMLSKTLGDTVGMAEALSWLGHEVFLHHHDYVQACTYMEDSLALYRDSGHIVGIIGRLGALGELALLNGNYIAAHERLQEALELQGKLRVSGVTSEVISKLGLLAMRKGDFDQAQAYFEESLSLCRESGQVIGRLWTLVNLGYAVLRLGDLTRAYVLFAEAIREFHTGPAPLTIGLAYALEGMASLAVQMGQAERAVRLYASSDAMRDEVLDRRPPVEQDDIDREFAAIRAVLDEAAFAAAWAAGRALSLEQVVAEARATAAEMRPT